MPRCLVCALLIVFSAQHVFAQDTVARVYADRKNQVHVVSTNGKDTLVAPEPGQIGTDSAQTAEDRKTVGWLVQYKDPDGGAPLAGTLVIWRAGKVIRRFQVDQTFWSWAFYAKSAQVAWHDGPTHGETNSHCELHDINSGRLLSTWDGDLEDANRPPWTEVLTH